MRRIGKGADRLDGLHAGSFLRSDANDTASGQLTFSYDDTSNDFSQLYIRGASTHSGITVNPPASKQAHYRFQTNGTNKWQIRAPFQDGAEAPLKIYSFSSTADKFVFNHDGSASFNGGTVWTSGNDGSGSGLDADMLDGSHASAFASSSSPTFTGDLVLSHNDADNSSPLIELRNINAGGYAGDIKFTATWGSTLHTSAQIRAYPGPNSSGGELAFETGGSERLRIDSSGDVDIGSGAVFGSNTLTGDGQNDVFMFATSPTSGVAQSGAYHNKLRILGGSGQSRDLQLYQIDSEYAHIGSSWSSNQLTIDSSFTQVNITPTTYIGGNTAWHAGNDGSGSGLDADTVDGYHAIDFVKDTHTAHDAVNLSAGWYTIATNTGDRACARFAIRDLASSRHQAVVFYASHHFGNMSDITVLHNSKYSGSPIRYIRIREGGTYDGAMVQVYLDEGTNQVGAYLLGDNFHSNGWVLKDWVHENTNPGGLNNYSACNNTACQVDIDQSYGGVTTTGSFWGGGDTTQYYHWHTGNDGSGSGLDADTCDGQHLGTGANVTFNYIHLDGALNGITGQGAWYGRNYAYNTVELLGYGAELMIGAQSGSSIHINYRYCNGSSGYTPSNWYWREGTSSSWSDHNFGHVTSNGNVYATGNVTAYSDIRLKENIRPIQNALDVVSKLEGVHYTRKETGEEEIGFIAQDVKEVFPELVQIIDSRVDDPHEGLINGLEDLHVMKYQNAVALLVEAIKEQQAQINELNTKVS